MSFPLSVRAALALAIVPWLVTEARGVTIYVATCGNDAWTGTNPNCDPADGPKATIQAAIDAAVNGDEVVVLDGTYTGVGNKDLDFGGKAITVRSENGPAGCIIDCQGNGRGFHFHSGEIDTSSVIGLTITGGNVANGGGMFCEDGSPTLRNCIFAANSAGHGGGMANGTNSSSGNPKVINCLFIGNTATGHGGGMHNLNSNPEVTNCTFTANQASTQPDGGIANLGGSGGSNPVITNCILWDNLCTSCVLPAEIGDQTGSSAIVNYTCIKGGWTGTGNIDTDPMFVDPGNDDYHLSAGSPCIDAGDNDAVPLGVTTDLDDDPRFVDEPNAANTGNGACPVDMGAYEFQAVPACGDCDGDGIDDPSDPDDDNDGVLDVDDVCPCSTLGVPVDCYGRPLRDCNGDCNFDGLDVQCIVAELLGT